MHRQAIDCLENSLRKDAADIRDLVSLVAANGSNGMTSADVTRLRGRNEYRLLALAEKHDCLKSNPTGMRARGRRWYAPAFYPGEL